MLLAQYFECVDPIYPMIPRHTFYAEYERFWAMDKIEKDRYDAAFVALIFVMLALGMQFVSTSTNPKDRKQTAEFVSNFQSYLCTPIWSVSGVHRFVNWGSCS